MGLSLVPARRYTGSREAASFAGNAFPVTQFITEYPDPVPVDTWRLRVTGAVRQDLELTYEDILRYADELTATVDCKSGWYSTQRPTWVARR